MLFEQIKRGIFRTLSKTYMAERFLKSSYRLKPFNYFPLTNTFKVLIYDWHWVQRRIRTAATSKMERFVIIVNGFQPLTIITKSSILDVASVLDSPLGWEKIILDSSSKIMLVLMNRITTKYLNVVFDELITGLFSCCATDK